MTDVAQLTRVGDGEFCATCFRALLDAGSADALPTAMEAPKPFVPPRLAKPARPAAAQAGPAAPSRRATCLVCDRDLSDAPAVVFLGGEICGPCSAEMAAELEAGTPMPSSQPSTQPSLAPSPGANASAGALEPAPDRATAALPFTPGTATVSCAGCERPMPGPGSYRVLHGKPYCAACLPFFARLPPSAHESAPSAEARVSPSSIPASSSPLARPGQCDCCRRALDGAAAQREGFELCSACLSSDPELALSVARARHRRALGRLRSKLEGAE
ncbi:MAG TPA: hypothetical protein VMG12_31740 [Polyangiaceae bacterium]|nr:hypothetical protein [Polyangiaceae bacterium]